MSRGRPKGSKNKVKLLGLRESLARAGVDPAEELQKLLPLLDPGLQAKVWLELLPYIYTKPTKELDPVEELRLTLTPEQVLELNERIGAAPHQGLAAAVAREYEAELEAAANDGQPIVIEQQPVELLPGGGEVE